METHRKKAERSEDDKSADTSKDKKAPKDSNSGSNDHDRDEEDPLVVANFKLNLETTKRELAEAKLEDANSKVAALEAER